MIQTVFWKCNNFPMTVGLFIGRSVIISLKGEKLHLHALVFNSVALHFLLCDKILVISCQCALMFNILLSTCWKTPLSLPDRIFCEEIKKNTNFPQYSSPLYILAPPSPWRIALHAPDTIIDSLCSN